MEYLHNLNFVSFVCFLWPIAKGLIKLGAVLTCMGQQKDQYSSYHDGQNQWPHLYPPFPLRKLVRCNDRREASVQMLCAQTRHAVLPVMCL